MNQPTSDTVTDWRAELTPDQLAQVEESQRYALRWAGMTNNSPLMLIAKLTALLDEKKED